MDSYDVWSGSSVPKNLGEQRAPPPLAQPVAQLPPLPPKPKRRRLFVKTKVHGSEQPPLNRPDAEMETGYEQPHSRPESETIPPAAQSPAPMKIDSHTLTVAENDEQMQLGSGPHKGR